MTGAQRGLWLKRAPVSVVVVQLSLTGSLGAVLLLGCGHGLGAVPRQARSPRIDHLDAHPAGCAARGAGAVSYNGWRAAGVTLAPSGARAIRLCRYGGLPALRLQASRLLTGASVKELTAEFDRLPALRPDHPATACPADFGSRVIAHLAYPDGQQVTIAVALTGCNHLTNGNLRRSAAGFGHPPTYGPRLIAELERLTAGQGPSRRLGRAAAAGGAVSALAGDSAISARSARRQLSAVPQYQALVSEEIDGTRRRASAYVVLIAVAASAALPEILVLKRSTPLGP